MVKQTSAVPIPSATAVLLRDSAAGPEVLLLLRNSKLKFAPGAWVFPGGRIDPEDYGLGSRLDIQPAARRAASREAFEEAGVRIDAEELLLIDHFVTPAVQPRRFATWFFIADANHCRQVTIDDGEIVDYRWLTMDQALQDHHDGKLPLVRPTRVTLQNLRAATSVEDVLTGCLVR
jgi:8-oxo-dGTP pyrophosphatase MutT (NUDIX family)